MYSRTTLLVAITNCQITCWRLSSSRKIGSAGFAEELGTLVFAAILVIVVVICCLVFLFNSQSAPAEKDWARSVLMAVLTGAVGFAFGKATK